MEGLPPYGFNYYRERNHDFFNDETDENELGAGPHIERVLFAGQWLPARVLALPGGPECPSARSGKEMPVPVSSHFGLPV